MAETQKNKHQTGYAVIKTKGGGFAGTVILKPYLEQKKVVSCIIDAHMHIQSGSCAPLPLLYNQIEEKAGFNPKETPGVRSRAWIDWLGSIRLGYGAKLSTWSSTEIGKQAIEDNYKTYLNVKNSYDYGQDEEKLIKSTNTSYKDYEYVFCPMIAMPMDMEYAHIAGYEGQTIYHEENGKVFYYHRTSGCMLEERGELIDLSHEIDKKKKTLKLKKWFKQIKEHIQSAGNYPFLLIPMYHYDPRRWRFSGNDKTDEESFNYGSWDYPFRYIATESEAGLFIGFKMYPPLGYRPLDDNLPYLKEYYKKCEEMQIPILAHCSPGGMTTHEKPFYKDYLEKGLQLSDKAESSNTPSKPNQSAQKNEPEIKENDTFAVADATDTAGVSEKALAEQWFTDNFVHPKAWRKVLDKFPSLRLCLAHFGADLWQTGPASVGQLLPGQTDWIQEIIDLTKQYDNVYTDISCFDIGKNMPAFEKALRDPKNAHLKDKILFGTDWYMTLLVLDTFHNEYHEYCKALKEALDEIDDSLWIRFTFINPVTFYGFDNMKKMDKMYDALDNKNVKEDILKSNYDKFTKALNEIEAIKKSLS